MADIDTSTYVKQQSSGPFDMVGKIANLQNTMNQNRLFQQEFKSKLGLSKIYKNAIDTNTGQLDPSKIDLNDPDVTLGLPDAFKNSQEAQKRNIDINSAQLENATKHLQAAAGYFAPLSKPGSSSKDVEAALAHAITNGQIDVPQATRLYSTLPRDQTGKIDESQIPVWAQQQQLQVMSTMDRLNAMNPAPTMQQLPGGGQAPFVMPQIGQVQQVGDTIQPAPAPTTTTVGPDGVPRYIGNPQGNNPYEAAYQQSQGRAAPTGGGIAPGGNIAGLPASLSPASSAALQKSGEDSATQLAALRSEVGGSANRVLQLQNASTALEGALTGKGSQKIQDLQALLVTTGMASEAQAQRVKNFDEAKKYMLGSMLSRGAGLGINTNEKLAALSGASPNTEISKLAAKDILRTNIGLEKAQQAQYAAFQNAGVPPDQFANWAAQWSTNRDLRAYTIAQATAADRKKFVESLKPAERAKFAATLTEAVRLGILPLSDFAK